MSTNLQRRNNKRIRTASIGITVANQPQIRNWKSLYIEQSLLYVSIITSVAKKTDIAVLSCMLCFTVTAIQEFVFCHFCRCSFFHSSPLCTTTTAVAATSPGADFQNYH